MNESGSAAGHAEVIEAVADGPTATQELWRVLLEMDWVATSMNNDDAQFLATLDDGRIAIDNNRVENAIRHGIVRDTDAGLLVVSATRTGDFLEISVLDDGPGIDPAAPAPPGHPT